MSTVIRRTRVGDVAQLVPLVEQYLAFYNVKHPRVRVSRFVSQKLRAKPVLIWVGSRARGAGMGRALIEAVIAEAKRSGVRTVELTTAVTNTPARAGCSVVDFPHARTNRSPLAQARASRPDGRRADRRVRR